MSTHPFAPVLAGLAILLTGCAPDRTAGPSALPTTPNAIVYGSPDVANTYSNVGAFIVQAPNGRVIPIC